MEKIKELNKIKVILSKAIEEYEQQKLNYELPIMLGVSENGKQNFADFVDLNQIITVGQTGSGKSMFQDAIIYTLCTIVPGTMKFFLVDMKKLVLGIYHELPLITPIIQNCEDYFVQMDLLIKEKDRRLKLSNLKKLPYIVVIIDTISDLTSFDKNRFETQLSNLLKDANKAKIHLLISDSRINSTTFSSKTLSIFPTKICFTTTTPESSKYIIGSDKGSLLKGEGDALLVIDKNEPPIRIQTPYVSDKELQTMTDKFKGGQRGRIKKPFRPYLRDLEDDRKYMKDNLNIWFRWILVFPGALITGILATYPLHWMISFLFNDDESVLGSIKYFSNIVFHNVGAEAVEYMIYPFVIAMVFVISAYKIAPKFKLRTATMLFYLYIFGWIVALTISIGGGSNDMRFAFSGRTVMALLGAVLGLVQCKKMSKVIE